MSDFRDPVSKVTLGDITFPGKVEKKSAETVHRRAGPLGLDKKSWDIFKTWDCLFFDKNRTPTQDWQVFAPLFQAFDKCYELERNEVLRLLEIWNKKLEPLGGDPSFTNWRRFRPLRLGREEDWSDWLAHLIEKSKTGYFTRALFGLADLGEKPRMIVDRETEQDGYRADLVVKCENGIHVHVEVKTGDPNLDKTYETARIMRKKYRAGSAAWADYILLLESQVAQWEKTKDAGGEIIPYITWENVAVALRASLLFSGEPAPWTSWAYAFLGAIEQILLNHPYVDPAKKEITGYYFLDSMVDVLEEGLKDEN